MTLRTYKYDYILQNPHQRDTLAIHQLAYHGNYEQTRLQILENISLVTCKDDVGFTPAHYAAQEGHLEIFKLLTEIHSKLYYLTAANGGTPAHIAAMAGQLDIIKLIIQFNADIFSKRDLQERTPLAIAARHGKVNVLRYLLEQHSEVNDDRQLLQRLTLDAVKSGDIETVEWIIHYRNLDVIPACECDDIMLAIISLGHIECLDYLLKHGFTTLEISNENYFTPLHIAAQHSQIAMFRYLYDCLPNNSITAQDIHHNTPMHIASETGNAELIKFILSLHADLFIAETNLSGDTPLNILACNRQYELIDYITENYFELTTKQIYRKKYFPYSMPCPNCNLTIDFIRYSGMSNSYPHFYCDTCSNVFLLETYQMKLPELSEKDTFDYAALLNEIVNVLPTCECGGKFTPGADPKCPHCQFEIKHQDPIIERLTDPYMIVTRGSKEYDG